jgi:NAD(P)-dependent dehydrogenase (short-subunit alcohol dehydrogenase family)
MSDPERAAVPLSSRLRQQRIIIVGGGSGLGRATAEAALRLGAEVTILSRNETKLAAATQAMSAAGHAGRISHRVLDMTDDVQVAAWAGEMADSSIHHLVVTASQASHGPFATVPPAEARRLLNSKFLGPYSVAHACLPKLIAGGSITFFSGVLSRRPGLNCSALGATNSAVEGLTRALALELGPRLRVNCCSPGMVRTEAYAKQPTEQREAMFKSTGESLPVGRVGYPHEIADAVIFMMANSYLTGQVIDVDGGHTIRQYAAR